MVYTKEQLLSILRYRILLNTVKAAWMLSLSSEAVKKHRKSKNALFRLEFTSTVIALDDTFACLDLKPCEEKDFNFISNSLFETNPILHKQDDKDEEGEAIYFFNLKNADIKKFHSSIKMYVRPGKTEKRYLFPETVEEVVTSDLLNDDDLSF